MKTITLVALALFMVTKFYGQDVMNPYITALSVPTSNLTIFPQLWPTTAPSYTWANRLVIQGYAGEYQIFLHRHPWLEYTPAASGPDLFTSYGMEVVSFPFIPDCAFSTDGCTELGTTDRLLNMPTTSYDGTSQGWGDITNILPFPSLESDLQSLASYLYAQMSGTVGPHYHILPHTAIKHTVYIHCGPYSPPMAVPPVIYSFSWIYDNTRGRMRYYPFCNCNCNHVTTTNPIPCNMDDWDICFVPELLTKFIDYHEYGESDNSLFLPNGTLNYFPYTEIPNSGCTEPETGIPGNGTIYKNGINNYFYVYFPDYSLISVPALQLRGANIAGYENGQSNNVVAMGGIKHTYHVDRTLSPKSSS